MTFYDKYINLCKKNRLKPQSPEMIKTTGVTSASISGWKKGSLPKAEVLIRLADFFNVSIDYLLGQTEKEGSLKSSDLTPEELELVRIYREADQKTKLQIIADIINLTNKN